MMLRRCSCTLLRAESKGSSGGSSRISDLTDNLGSAAARVGSILKNLTTNPRATEVTSPRHGSDKPASVNPETSNEEYMVGPNFPLKEEPMAKEGFHHYLREHKLGNYTLTWKAMERDPDESLPLWVRDCQGSAEFKSWLMENLTEEELSLPPHSPDHPWRTDRVPRAIEHYPEGFPESKKQS
eukprot:TRINITY_DN25752_c0_g1_i1.p1 TRINITY_DN25752_c0_g1~~TRINITY_DN25752_c0_g1_i1.p1  ORF type:complete len:211 (+),score=41.52 TRINITY_DN25752_c0_g1_i1:87-635(+)